MTYYLWAILGTNLEVQRFTVTSDRTPTHSHTEKWVLIKEFTL